MRWDSVSDRVSISWAEVFAAIGAELKAPNSVIFYACAELRPKRSYSKRLVCISSWRACTATTTCYESTSVAHAPEAGRWNSRRAPGVDCCQLGTSGPPDLWSL